LVFLPEGRGFKMGILALLGVVLIVIIVLILV